MNRYLSLCALVLAAGISSVAQASLVGQALTIDVSAGSTHVSTYHTIFQNDGWGYVGGSLAAFDGVNGGLVEQAGNGLFFLQVLTDRYTRSVTNWRISLDFTGLSGEAFSQFDVFRDDFSYADAVVSHSANRLDIEVNGSFGSFTNAYFGFRYATQPVAEQPLGTVPEPGGTSLALIALGGLAVVGGSRRFQRAARQLSL